MTIINGENPDAIEPEFSEEYPNSEFYQSTTGVTKAQAEHVDFGAQVTSYNVYVKKLDINKLSYDGQPVVETDFYPPGYGLSWKKALDFINKAIAYGPPRTRDRKNPTKKDGSPKPLLVFDKAENFDEEGYLNETGQRELQNDVDNWAPTSTITKAEKDAQMKSNIKADIMADLGLNEDQFNKMVEKQRKK